MKRRILVVIFCILINTIPLYGLDINLDINFGEEGIKINNVSELVGIWEASVPFTLWIPPEPPAGFGILALSPITFSFIPLYEEENNLYNYKMILDFEPVLEHLLMEYFTNNDQNYSKDELWEIVITQMIKRDEIDDRFYIEKYSFNILLRIENFETEIMDMIYFNENRKMLLLLKNNFPNAFLFTVIVLDRI